MQFIPNITSQVLHKNTSFSANSSQTTTRTRVHDGEIIVWAVVMWLLCLIGAVNNFLLLLVTFPNSNHKLGFNVLIFHFVLLNLFMCGVNIPIRIIMMQMKHYGIAVPPCICPYIQAVYNLTWLAVNWSDASMALNRFLALFFPHLYKNLSGKAFNLWVIVISWAFSVATTVPPASGFGADMALGANGQCVYTPRPTVPGRVFHVLTYLPYAATGLGAVLMFGKMYCSNRGRVYGLENLQVQRTVARRIRLTKMLLLSFLWTAICVIPTPVMVANFLPVMRAYPSASFWLLLAVTSQYALASVILLVSNSEYQSRLRTICGNICDERKPSSFAFLMTPRKPVDTLATETMKSG